MHKRKKLDYFYLGSMVASVIANILCIFDVVKRKHASAIATICNAISFVITALNFFSPVDELKEDVQEEVERDKPFLYAAIATHIAWIVSFVAMIVKDTSRNRIKAIDE